ncbi:hypothetical protein ACQKE0_19970 [Shewanella colwelliana]|uniref:hypothetical protein n=1 Tax=Shewanella colwelliana TaxID=23 RepID=UPI003D07DF4F
MGGLLSFSRLTLRMLQKQRIKNDKEAIERKEQAEFVRTMYSWENNLPAELRAKLEIARMQGNDDED